MTDGRKRTIAPALAGLALSVLGGLVVHAAAPAAAEPSLDDVQKKVDTLYHQAEVASETYNAARIQLKDSRSRLAAVRADVARQQQAVDRMRAAVASMMVEQYHGQSLSTATQVVFAEDQQRFLSNLDAASSFSSQRATVMKDFDDQYASLKLSRETAAGQVAALRKTEAVLSDQKAEIDAKAAKAKALLSTLKAKQRAELAASGGTTPGPLPAVSGGAGAAVRYALAQVGDAYVWGAAGPSAFDCSGLMMAAWAQAGVGLPHQSRAQMASGTPVSHSQLKPGDLVFYYSPVSHVGMYIGNGKIVHAANPSAGVEVSPVDSMPYAGAVRVG